MWGAGFRQIWFFKNAQCWTFLCSSCLFRHAICPVQIPIICDEFRLHLNMPSTWNACPILKQLIPLYSGRLKIMHLFDELLTTWQASVQSGKEHWHKLHCTLGVWPKLIFHPSCLLKISDVFSRTFSASSILIDAQCLSLSLSCTQYFFCGQTH